MRASSILPSPRRGYFCELPAPGCIGLFVNHLSDSGASQSGQRGADFPAFGLDEIQQFGGGRKVFISFRVRIDRFQVIDRVFDLLRLGEQLPGFPAQGLMPFQGLGFGRRVARFLALEIGQPGFPVRRLIGFLPGLGFQRGGGIRSLALAGGEIDDPALVAGAAGRQPGDEVGEVVFKGQRLALGDAPVRVLPCQRLGRSMPCTTRLARAMG